MKILAFACCLIFSPLALAAQVEPARPLSFQVNSGYDESWPMVSPEGRALYFSRIGHPQNMGETDAPDIWVAYRMPGGQWSKAVNLGAPANSREGEAVVGVSASGRRLYLHQLSAGRLSSSARRGRSWLPPRPLEVEKPGKDGEAVHLYIHHDGRIMLVSMDGAGSLGQRDLYVSFAGEQGQWGPLQHLGPVANSAADEAGVFLAADGKTLYFSSGRPGGLGGQDLYCSRRLDETWSNWTIPQNLGEGINTPEDDVFLSMPASGKPVILVRRTGDGQSDLFEASLPEALQPGPVLLLRGQARDAVSGKAVDAPIRALGAGVPEWEEWAGPEGAFQFILPYGQPISVEAEAPGCFSIAEPGPEALQAKVLDYDNAALLASVGNDVAYQQRNAEIEQLQLHLRVLDDELIALKQQRKSHLQALRQLPATLRGEEGFSSPELDALRHRYEQYQHQSLAQDTSRNPVPERLGAPQASGQELDSLKARYQRYQDYHAARQQVERTQEEESGMLWEEAMGFEDFRQEVEYGLAESLAPAVSLELSAGMLEEVKQEILLSLGQRERRQLELKEEAMRQEIRKSFIAAPPAPGQWARRGGEPETAWEQKLRAGLKAAVEPEVRALLEEELRDDIRAALRSGLTYWAKKEAQAEIQAELDQKLQQQIETERRRQIAPASGKLETIPPLSPPAPAGYREIELGLLLAPAETGQLIPLRQVGFEPNKALFLPDAYPELERLAAFLLQNPELVVEIGAHTGGQLSHSLALGLSVQRARAVAAFLREKGVREECLTFKGYGKSVPIADNSSPAGQRQNQRIELRIIDKLQAND